MYRIAATLIRVMSVSLGAAAVLLVLFWVGDEYSNSFHANAILWGAVIFAASDVFFFRFVGEIDSTIRHTSLSLTQSENLRAQLIPVRNSYWGLWWASVALKGAAGLMTLIINHSQIDTQVAKVAMIVGYCALFLGFPVLWAMVRGFRSMEKLRDDLSQMELQFRERKRLREDLVSGVRPDFGKDKAMNRYSQKAKSLAKRQ